MKLLSISMFKRVSILLMCALLFLPACARQPQPARIEEIAFQSGEFALVGELRPPGGTGPFLVVIFVHGEGGAKRTLLGIYLPILNSVTFCPILPLCLQCLFLLRTL